MHRLPVVPARGARAGTEGDIRPTEDEIERARLKTTTESHFPALVVLPKHYQRLDCFRRGSHRVNPPSLQT
ncbi:hypothetical protein CDG81_10575 [Actinopolyspora erythraea]|uniref:Uncharacterized protein n=1 Tax=Actinopolyspora erythraea TaxID=414996 RepID=A0A099D7N4_9ACTN|nr:hypothetical protein CDG81_10575 [Actinopolyspora erythraea]KGI81405.1 hypothetical protein IL38_10600 [Actinopolyspora erythraea]